MNVYAEKLKSKNLKVTTQRLAIYTYLAGTDTHPNAVTIYNELKKNYPSMSLATVYKNVASLRDADLVQEINMGEDSYRYDANTNFHSHLICTECGNVFDYSAEKLNFCSDTDEEIDRQLGFKVKRRQMFFYGTCGCCTKNITTEHE